MKYLLSTCSTVILGLLCGCGGGAGTSIPGPPPLSLDVNGDWQFSLAPASNGAPPLNVAGSIHQSSTSLSGALHVIGSNCFDPISTVDLSGILNGSKVVLASTSIGGQVTTLSGTISDTVFTGSYKISGGCADGDHGSVSGTKIPSIAGTMSGTFTPAGGQGFGASFQVTESSATNAGTFGLTGTAAFDPGCLSSGTIQPGPFPTGSFVLGTTVVLEIGTDNGILDFVGTIDQDRSQISGDYKVSGGTCDHAGAAVLSSDPWGY